MQQYVEVQQFPIIYWQNNSKNLSLNQLQDKGRKKYQWLVRLWTTSLKKL